MNHKWGQKIGSTKRDRPRGVAMAGYQSGNFDVKGVVPKPGEIAAQSLSRCLSDVLGKPGRAGA